MQAFKRAKELGVDYLELDVHLTLDEKVVVIHDESLRRLCDNWRKIYLVPYKDLDKLRKDKIKLHFPEPDQPFYEIQPGDDLTIPLLEEVLDLGIPINIELKNYSSKLMQNTLDILEKKKCCDKVVWGTQKAAHAKEMREEAK